LVLIDFSMGDFHRFPNHQTPHFPTQLAEALHGEDHVEIYRATAATDQTISAHGFGEFPTGLADESSFSLG
jgi:hypothetical protein